MTAHGKQRQTAAEIVVTGSLAYDFILSYPGDFRDHLIADKMHVLSISLLVPTMKQQRGGTAGNMAYSLALLGQTCSVLATVGAEDFETYRAFLANLGVDTDAIVRVPDDLTASFHALTDSQNNSFGGFYEGAMRRSDLTTFHRFDPATVKLALIGPTVPEAITRFPGECRDLGIPFVYSPAWQTSVMDGPTLAAGIKGATAVLGSDYEFATMTAKTGLSEEAMLGELAPNGALVKTLGGNGSLIRTRNTTTIVPIAPVETVVDPTGGGDAYAAGLLMGMVRGWPWQTTGRVAALAATYAIEQYGPQAHAYTQAEFAARYYETFGVALNTEDVTAKARAAAVSVGE